jgi:hypothetical protein
MSDFPDGTLRRERDIWRQKVSAARDRFEANRSQENRVEFRRVLKVFSDLVNLDKMPEEESA